MTYERTTATERKAAERANARYLHVSVLVGSQLQELSDGIKMRVPTRTPKGKGGTATRKISKQAIRLARKEVKRELRREAQRAH